MHHRSKNAYRLMGFELNLKRNLVTMGFTTSILLFWFWLVFDQVQEGTTQTNSEKPLVFFRTVLYLNTSGETKHVLDVTHIPQIRSKRYISNLEIYELAKLSRYDEFEREMCGSKLNSCPCQLLYYKSENYFVDLIFSCNFLMVQS